MAVSKTSIPRLDKERAIRRGEEPSPVEKLPAQNNEMEAKLLGALLYYSPCLPLVRHELVFPKDARVRPFYVNAHQVLYETMCDLYDAGQVPEYETVKDELVRLNKMESVGDDHYIFGIMMRTLDDPALNISAETRDRVLTQWAQRLKKHAIRRACIDIATTAAGIAYPSDAQAVDDDPAEDMHKLSESITQLYDASTVSSRFKLRSIEDLRNRPRPQWIVPGMLQERKQWLVFGDSNTGKSFLGLDLGLCMATGTPWNGKAMPSGHIVYVCAEGADGIRDRIDAWLAAHHLDTAPHFHVIDDSPNLLEHGDVQEVIRNVKALEEPVLAVVFDTLASSMEGGDENSAEDMGLAVAAVRRVQRECASAVLTVHHSGKDVSKGSRGHSSLRAAMDTVIEVSRDEFNLVTVKCNKAKDAPYFAPMTFRLDTVALDDYGDVTSCILTPCEAATPDAPRKHGRTTSADKLLGIMSGLTTGGATHSELKRQFMDATGMSLRSFNLALDELETAGRIENISGYWRYVTKHE